MPSGILDKNTSQDGTEQGTEEAGNRDKIKDFEEHPSGIGPQHDESAYRHQEGPSDTLDDTGRCHHAD